MSSHPNSNSHCSTELPPASIEVKLYQQLKLTARLISMFASFGFWVLAVWAGPRLDVWVRQTFTADPWPRLVILAVLYAAAVELLNLPLAYWSGFVLEHRFQLSNQTVAAWLWSKIKRYLVGGAIGLLLLSGLYCLLWTTGSLWWIWASAGWLMVTLVLGRVAPLLIMPLFYKITRLSDETLLERFRHLCAGTGLTVEGVYRLNLSIETKKVNAALAGMGKTRRVLLADTLLEQFSPEEIAVVFAHEVGHHVYRHLHKMVVWGVVTTMASFWLVDFLVRAWGRSLGYHYQPIPLPADPAALPLVLLILSLSHLILSPIENALSRFFETQCDRYALEKTQATAAYRSAFTKLALLNKSDPDPLPLVVWLFYDHPPIRQRLAMARDEC